MTKILGQIIITSGGGGGVGGLGGGGGKVASGHRIFDAVADCVAQV